MKPVKKTPPNSEKKVLETAIVDPVTVKLPPGFSVKPKKEKNQRS